MRVNQIVSVNRLMSVNQVMGFNRYWLFLISLLIATFADAVELNIQSYQNARMVFQSRGEVDEYNLALGSYKKIQGTWSPEREERLSGELTRYTLELPDGHSAANGFDFYLDQLNTYNYRELFHCAARDCGTSNSWANNHFKIIQLYGLDQYQEYGAYEVTSSDDKPFYVVLYAVQRGNHRVYMQVEILHVRKQLELGIASNPDSIIRMLNTNGYYVFPDAVVDDATGNTHMNIKATHLETLAELMKKESNLKLALVGHDYAPVSWQQQQKDSLQYANQLQAALINAGVAAGRLSAFGLGALAPAGRGDRSARVEVVKLND